MALNELIIYTDTPPNSDNSACQENDHFNTARASCAHRLNSSDDDGEPLYIQMVTALVLQLIQCVVHLPNDKDMFEECEKVTAK